MRLIPAGNYFIVSFIGDIIINQNQNPGWGKHLRTDAMFRYIIGNQKSVVDIRYIFQSIDRSTKSERLRDYIIYHIIHNI